LPISDALKQQQIEYRGAVSTFGYFLNVLCYYIVLTRMFVGKDAKGFNTVNENSNCIEAL